MEDDTSQHHSSEPVELEEHSHIGIIVTIIGAILLLSLVILFLYMSGKNNNLAPTHSSEQKSGDVVDVLDSAEELIDEGEIIETEMRPSVVDSLTDEQRASAPPPTSPPNPSLPPPTTGGSPSPGSVSPPAVTSATPVTSGGGSSNPPSTPSPTPTSGGGGSTTPPVTAPTAVVIPDVTITRNTTEEPLTAFPDQQGDVALFQFTVETPLEYVDFEEVIFAVTVGNEPMYGTANTALQEDPMFHFEKQQPDGTWFRLISTSYSRYSGSIRVVRYVFDYGERIEASATYRLLASNLPCELVGNSLDISMLDSRGNTNALFDTPTTDATRDIVYAEIANPVQLTNCSSIRTVPRDPTLWLQFEEGSGTLYDSSGFGNHTTIQSGLAYQNPRTNTNAIRFVGGAPSYIEIPHNQNLAFSDPLTVEAYINPDIDGTWQGLISKGNGANQYDYHIAISPNNKLAYYTDFGPVWYEGTTLIPKNSWQHVAVTVGDCGVGDTGVHKGCELKMYVNGREETVSKYGTGYANEPEASNITLGIPAVNSITVGAWSGSSHINSYAGFMDDLVIYNRVLPQAEIEERYRGTR